jgi:hypothetical protein
MSYEGPGLLRQFVDLRLARGGRVSEPCRNSGSLVSTDGGSPVSTSSTTIQRHQEAELARIDETVRHLVVLCQPAHRAPTAR